MASKLGDKPVAPPVPESPSGDGRLIHYWRVPDVAVCGYRGPKALDKATWNPRGPDVCAVCYSMVTGHGARRRA